MTKISQRSRARSNPPFRSVRALAIIGLVATVSVGVAWLSAPRTSVQEADIVVYKTSSCACCNRWVTHLRNNGLSVATVSVRDTRPWQEQFGVPESLGACHTARAGDYWVEGHVPADLIIQLLAEHPDDIQGIAVPGMPIGSPGMEGPNPEPYSVISVTAEGDTEVYATRGE